MTKVRIDDELCQGHARCYASVPEVFGTDELGHGTVLDAEVLAELTPRVLAAVKTCPEQAISVVD